MNLARIAVNRTEQIAQFHIEAYTNPIVTPNPIVSLLTLSTCRSPNEPSLTSRHCKSSLICQVSIHQAPSEAVALVFRLY